MLRKNMIKPEQRHRLAKAKRVLARARINFKAELRDFLPRSYQPLISDFRGTDCWGITSISPGDYPKLDF